MLYTKNTLLSYVNYYNISSDLLYSSRELGTGMLNRLLTYFDNDFSSIDVTIEDLGFLSW